MVAGFKNLDEVLKEIKTDQEKYTLFTTNREKIENPAANADISPWLKLLFLVKDHVQKISDRLAQQSCERTRKNLFLSRFGIASLIKRLIIVHPKKADQLSLFFTPGIMDLALASFMKKVLFRFSTALFDDAVVSITHGFPDNDPLRKSREFYQHFHLILRIMGVVGECLFINWGRWILSDIVKHDTEMYSFCARLSLGTINAGYGNSPRWLPGGKLLDNLFLTGPTHNFELELKENRPVPLLTQLKVDAFLSEETGGTSFSDLYLSKKEHLPSIPSGVCSCCNEEKLFIFPDNCMDCLAKVPT